MSTQQQWQITGTIRPYVGAPIPLGVFETKSGGDPSWPVEKHREGGMGKEVAFTGLPTFSDLTIGRRFDRVRDAELYRRIVGLRGADASISAQPLDPNGAPQGRPYTFTGKLMSATDPEVDAQSSTPSNYQLMFSITDRA